MSIEVRPEPRLSERTTLGLGGLCLSEVAVTAEAGLDRLARVISRQGGRPFVLGSGSNLLALDHYLPLVLVRHEARDLTISRFEDEHGNRPLVTASGGMRLQVLLGRLAKTGCSGLEGLTGIPGSVGGAVAMNAGSYGTQISDRVRRVRFWTPERGLFWKEAAELAFGYRSFDPAPSSEPLDKPWLVWTVELMLDDAEPDAIRARMAETMGKKVSTQPIRQRTAGCVFKNPEGHSAGKLLDQAGFRGKTLGGMAFSPMHANFLVNTGKGTAKEALELIDRAKDAVRARFDLTLDLEVKVVS